MGSKKNMVFERPVIFSQDGRDNRDQRCMKQILFKGPRMWGNCIRSLISLYIHRLQFLLCCTLAQTLAKAFERIQSRYCAHAVGVLRIWAHASPWGRVELTMALGKSLLSTPKRQCARLPRHTQGQHPDRKAMRQSASHRRLHCNRRSGWLLLASLCCEHQ